MSLHWNVNAPDLKSIYGFNVPNASSIVTYVHAANEEEKEGKKRKKKSRKNSYGFSANAIFSKWNGTCSCF